MKRRKSGELRLEERSKGVEGKKTARNTVMDTGLCRNFCLVCFDFLLPYPFPVRIRLCS